LLTQHHAVNPEVLNVANYFFTDVDSAASGEPALSHVPPEQEKGK